MIPSKTTWGCYRRLSGSCSTLKCGGKPRRRSRSSRYARLTQEFNRQKKQLALDAIEREEKLQNESKKPGASPPKKKPAPPAPKKPKEKPPGEERTTDLEFKFTRVDVMTLVCLFAAACDKASAPDMVKFWNCDLSDAEVATVSSLLQRESSLRATQATASTSSSSSTTRRSRTRSSSRTCCSPRSVCRCSV